MKPSVNEKMPLVMNSININNWTFCYKAMA